MAVEAADVYPPRGAKSRRSRIPDARTNANQLTRKEIFFWGGWGAHIHHFEPRRIASRRSPYGRATGAPYPVTPALISTTWRRGCNGLLGTRGKSRYGNRWTRPRRPGPTSQPGSVFFPDAPGNGRTRPTTKFIYPSSRQRGPIFGQRNNAGRALPEGSARR